ncbi:MAG: hypothetical protein AAB414_02940 [Patescibacteria group bacterium]
MDFLQVALIFLILLISIFLAIAGFQVFFILRDLHKSLRRLDKILETSQDIAKDIEKPAKLMSNITTGIETGGRAAANLAKIVTGVVKSVPKLPKPKSKRFYKKVL